MQLPTTIIFLCAVASVSCSISSTHLRVQRSALECPQKIAVCPKLTCDANNFGFCVDKQELLDLKVDIYNIHLLDRSCKANVIGDKVCINWALGAFVCGTTAELTDTHVTYKNIMFLPPDPVYVIYREEYRFNVSCTFPLDLLTSLGTVLYPIIVIISIPVDGYGEFQVGMAVYKDASFITPYDSDVFLSTHAMLYVGVFIYNDYNNEFNLVMKNCYATPTMNPNDLKKYDIIMEGCSNTLDKTIKIVENGESSKGKFQVQMFKFIGDHSRVYLHCEVYLCHKSKSCKPNCFGRKSNNELPEALGSLRLGPINRSDPPTDDADPPTDAADPPTDAAGKSTSGGFMLFGFLLSSYLFF
ncbi:uromodulin-like isoform X1 [Xenopus laevis]|uniref:Uromodulin-like isoform X1 n=1 Tax=Xenopus laevis TaxID=8355 RepID=A0A8J1LQN6_XENLA|nr:uromodulin-like isoform X1 [Xenopus laevis]